MSKRLTLSFVLSLVLLMTFTSLVSAGEELIHPFADEVEGLTTLKILPEKGWKASGPVTYREFITTGKKLIEGRGVELYLPNYENELGQPEANIDYQHAIKYAAFLMGYTDEAGITKIEKKLNELDKEATEEIDGYDMAYILYNLLYSHRNGQEKTVLKERYLLGDSPMFTSKVLTITGDQIVLEDEGAYPLAEDVQAFLTEDNKIKPLGFNRVSVGMSNLEVLFDKEGKIKTVLISELKFPENIRVIISSKLSRWGSSQSRDFDEIKVKAEKPFKLITHNGVKDKIEYVVSVGEVVSFINEEGQILFKSGNYSQRIEDKVYLKSYYPHNLQFEVLSTKRHGSHPTYAGHLEIIPGEEEKLYLINDLPIETYLRKVVPSEIPISWSTEAFKVQAIAARSYAISQIVKGRFEAKSANVDDSTASQVYNNCKENKRVNQAIKETEGIVPLYDGKVIDAVFSSTSSGATASNESVWHSYRTGEFPGQPIPYLRTRSQLVDAELPDLTVEENALEFYKNQEIEGFDSISPYYRWRIELTREELENTISLNLPKRERADTILKSDFIQTVAGTPLKEDDKEFSIGTLEDLKVVKRGEGGNMMILDIVGSEGTYRVMKEYNIRFVIRPRSDMTKTIGDIILYRHDGSKLRDYSILPSAFAAFDIERGEKDQITKVTIYGGGNGHGVGMSQWGMKGMADNGYTYNQILKHYYSDIQLKKIY